MVTANRLTEKCSVITHMKTDFVIIEMWLEIGSTCH